MKPAGQIAVAGRLEGFCSWEATQEQPIYACRNVHEAGSSARGYAAVAAAWLLRDEYGIYLIALLHQRLPATHLRIIKTQSSVVSSGQAAFRRTVTGSAGCAFEEARRSRQGSGGLSTFVTLVLITFLCR